MKRGYTYTCCRSCHLLCGEVGAAESHVKYRELPLSLTVAVVFWSGLRADKCPNYVSAHMIRKTLHSLSSFNFELLVLWNRLQFNAIELAFYPLAFINNLLNYIII